MRNAEREDATHSGCAGVARWINHMTHRITVDVKIDAAACLRALAWLIVVVCTLLL